MKLKKILWAYDGSKEATNALKVAEYFTHLYGSDIIGIYVNYVFPPITPIYSYYAGYIEEAAEKCKLEFKKEFKEIKEELLRKKINFTSKVITGEVEKSINELSTQRKADIVIIGNSGKNLLTRILIGSNTLKILRTSKVPVLTVPGIVKGNKYKINKILVPLNISEENTGSINYAINLALKTNSSITITYVLSATNNITEFPAEVVDQIIKRITKSLDEIVLSSKENAKKLNPDHEKEIESLRIRKKMLVGLTPAIRIVDYAKRNEFDLIVINSHGKGKIESFTLGSVSEEVIRNSKCPVIVIKPDSN